MSVHFTDEETGGNDRRRKAKMRGKEETIEGETRGKEMRGNNKRG